MCAVVSSWKVSLSAFATGLGAIHVHVAFIFSSANSPTLVLVTSGIRNFVLARWRRGCGVVHI